MKLYRPIFVVLLFLATGFGLTWAFAKYIATPPPSGETYRLVPDWPRKPDGITLGQVAGIGIDSHGDVFVFHRAERIWEGEELSFELIPSPTVFVLDDDTGDLV